MRVKAILRVLVRRYSKINGNLRIFNELNSFPVLPCAKTSYVFFQFFHVKPLFISSPVLTSCSRGYSSYSFQLFSFAHFELSITKSRLNLQINLIMFVILMRVIFGKISARFGKDRLNVTK